MPSSEGTASMTIRLPAGLKGRLQELADATGNHITRLAQDAVRFYLEFQEWQIAEIEAGLADADQQRFATEDQVRVAIKNWKSTGIRWTQKAVASLAERVAEHIARGELPAADDLAQKVAAGVLSLKDLPSRGQPGRVSGVRELFVLGTPCLIPYRLRGQNIEVLRLLVVSPVQAVSR
jgi:toxin ParE1/3/4